MSEFARTLESWKGCDPKAMVGMSSAAIQYALSDAKHDIVKLHADFDRVTAERDGLQISLNTADQSIDDLNAAISRRTHRVRELEGLLRLARQFVTNGVELGYITMPDPETPDAAHDLVPMIDAALKP